MDEPTKNAIKEAIREWLEEEKKKTYESIGKWIVNVFVVTLLLAFVYLMLWANGWRHT